MSVPRIGYFRAIHGATGVSNEKDMKVAAFQNRFGFEFDSSINVVHGALRNDVPQDFIIVPTDEGCNLWARPGETFDIGDIIFYNKLHWLIVDVNFSDDLTRSGKMVRCNRQIRWQNRTTGAIVERWCLATKPYTSNIAKGITIANSNREFKIQLAYDDETMLIDLDRRFLLEVIDGMPKAYQVTSVDTITNRYQDIDGGFLVWNLTQCEYNPLTDNPDLMIADYVDYSISTDHDAELVIEGRDTIPIGSSRIYTLRDASRWDVSPALPGVGSRFEGENLTLSLEYDMDLVGTTILVTAQVPDGRMAVREVKVVDLF